MHRVVTLRELAARVGLPRQWLKQEAAAGRLPCLRVGRTLRFNVEAVESALARRAAEPRTCPPGQSSEARPAEPEARGI